MPLQHALAEMERTLAVYSRLLAACQQMREDIQSLPLSPDRKILDTGVVRMFGELVKGAEMVKLRIKQLQGVPKG